MFLSGEKRMIQEMVRKWTNEKNMPRASEIKERKDREVHKKEGVTRIIGGYG